MPKKKEPLIVYGNRVHTLGDLSRACDDMKATAARRACSPDQVVFKAYVHLDEGDELEVVIDELD